MPFLQTSDWRPLRGRISILGSFNPWPQLFRDEVLSLQNALRPKDMVSNLVKGHLSILLIRSLVDF